MEKIALITDSTTGLLERDIDEYGIHVIRLKVIYKEREYVDGIEITPEEVYDRLDEEVPTTSMPSVQEIMNLYEKLVDEGYTHAIVMPISSGLSGTINSFVGASEHYKDKLKFFIFDTKIISMAVGLSVLKVAKMIKENKSFDYICNQIPILREKTKMFFTVDTLEYLIKGGRIGKISGSIGEFLNLKPIIMMNEEGKYTTYSKVRGANKAVNTLIQLAHDILDKAKGTAVIVTGTMLKEAEVLKNTLIKHPNITFTRIATMTPVVGVHSGPRLLGFAILED